MTVTGWPAIAIVLGVAAVVLGAPLGLYFLLTRKQRAVIREIRQRAEERGWKFGVRRWMGDPTAIRIEGRGRNGMSLILKSRGTEENNRGWAVVLSLRFPELAGEPDFGLMPRTSDKRDLSVMATGVSAEMQARVAAISGTAAGALGLIRDGKEMPSGAGAFDAAYHVVGLPGRFTDAPIGSGLAEKIMKWPAEAVAAHSILAWRDPFGLHVQARLPGPANWGTICWLVEIGEELCGRIPAGRMTGEPSGVVDRVAGWFLER